jgi:hypothetical protein
MLKIQNGCTNKMDYSVVVDILSPVRTVFSQYTGKNNYTGDWKTPKLASTWTVPNDISGLITINGYITANDSLSFQVLPVI